MRPFVAVLAVSVIALTASSFPTSAEVTRTLKAEIAPESFAVENLAGAMRVVSGSSDKVVVVATVHAEDDDVAAAVSLDMVAGESVPTLRVRYPLDRYRTFRYQGEGREEGDVGSFFWSFFGGSNTSTKYDGRNVKISNSSGVLLHVDLEVQIPRRSVDGKFRNVVGRIHGEGIAGKLVFDSGNGDVTLKDVEGVVKADTGSGDVKASDIRGSFSCDTGSGDCDLTGFNGDIIECDVGSGEIRVSASTAKRIKADTGSGSVRVMGSEVEEFDADTGSGDVLLDARGARLTRVSADTGSGNVTLRLGPDATFEATADQGSGDLVSRYPDAQPIVRDREVIGYRRGDARIRIVVDTGSGDFTLEPGAPSGP